VGLLPGGGYVDTGIGFTWFDTFNGTAGGISTSASDLSTPVDPGSGTGGITVTGVQNTMMVQPPSTQTLTSGSACNGVYSGIFNGNVTVSAGQNCEFVNGSITGNVQVRGGNLALSDDLIGGNLQISGGGFSVTSFTAIEGNLQVQNLPSGTVLNEICDSTVNGNLQFQNNGTPVQIGSASSSSCGGNVIGGNLQVQNNTAATAIFDNTIQGNLQDQNNTGSTQVFSNTTSGNLQCENDASITGGDNAAKQLQGQCANF